MKYEWVKNICNQIIDKYGENDTITCQCGISTTGVAHIGNFRELIITYFISEYLKYNGYNTKTLLSFDDFDRLKKVPLGVDKEYERYVGMPNYSIPCHIDKSIGYAEYFEKRIIKELNQLGIKMDYIFQHEKYLNNDYMEYIKIALSKRCDIFKILKDYKTQNLTDKDMEKYYPVAIYCSKCNKDTTTIQKYDEVTNIINYKCKCGNYESNKINNIKLKLKFNTEWPVKWNMNNVNFEPCGKGHSETYGVLNVSREIQQKIFKKNPPIISTYQFFNLSNGNGRMNKNSKELITITDALEVMQSDLILYLFYKNSNDREMKFSFCNDIPKLYAEYEDFINNEATQLEKNILHSNIQTNLKFKDIIVELPIVNFDLKKLQKKLDYEENSYNLKKIKCALNYLNKYSKNKYWEQNKEFNYRYYEQLSEERKMYLNTFYKLVCLKYKEETFDNIFDEFKQQCPQIKEFYKDFYNMIYGRDNGIPLRILFNNYDMLSIIELLHDQVRVRQ